MDQPTVGGTTLGSEFGLCKKAYLTRAREEASSSRCTSSMMDQGSEHKLRKPFVPSAAFGQSILSLDNKMYVGFGYYSVLVLRLPPNRIQLLWETKCNTNVPDWNNAHILPSQEKAVRTFSWLIKTIFLNGLIGRQKLSGTNKKVATFLERSCQEKDGTEKLGEMLGTRKTLTAHLWPLCSSRVLSPSHFLSSPLSPLFSLSHRKFKLKNIFRT